MADKDKQRYYWLKMDKDFFNEYKVRCLLSEKKGDTYCVILQQLKCESLNYGGVLRFSEARAYTTSELASVIGRPVKLLEEALKVLCDKELIEIKDDGTIVIEDVSVGSITGQTLRKNGKTSVENTEEIPKKDGKKSVKDTLESRDKRLDIEEDIKIKEITDRMLEMGYSAGLCEKALKLLNRDGYPHTAEFYQTILNTLTDSEIFNKEGYIYRSALNERNKA